MNLKLFARVVVEVAMAVALSGCWLPLVVGEPLMDNNETIYGVHVQPLFGFSDHKVVGVNVAARMEPDISGDRKPNASEIVGLAVGAVFHEVRGDVCGVQIGGLGATAKCVDGIQIAGMVMEVNLEHSSNALEPMPVSWLFAPNSTAVRLEHL